MLGDLARALAVPLALLAASPAQAQEQGFAGLAAGAQDFTPVTPPAHLVFPRDHGPHPGFRVEWWYLTANLSGPDGADYGIQWTLFRQPMAPGGADRGWESPQVWMAHAAVTTATDHRFAETFARGGVGQAGVTLEPFRARIDDWSMTCADGPGDALARLDLHAAGDGFAYDLTLATDLPPVPQGDAGYSVKLAEGQASYYYSQPFYGATGTISLDGETIPVTGRAWLDREWSSQPLAAGQEGWDWFALHLDDGRAVMVYRLRNEDGSAHVAGTVIAPDATPTPLPPDAIEAEPTAWSEVGGRRLPVAWHLAIPSAGLAVDIQPVNPQSWMGTSFAYWEGPIRVTGSAVGRGYLEMTGY
jgi:predicted secreted hydrolase